MQEVVKQKEPAELRHLTSREKAALSEFVARLREKYADEVMLVVLFGSKVRGDFDEESDLDVLVVVKDSDWRFRDEVALAAFEPMLEHDTVITPLVIDLDHYQWLQRYHAPLYRNIQAEGVDLWMRTPALSSASV
jgi:predicted nucleotidyltransferase